MGFLSIFHSLFDISEITDDLKESILANKLKWWCYKVNYLHYSPYGQGEYCLGTAIFELQSYRGRKGKQRFFLWWDKYGSYLYTVGSAYKTLHDVAVFLDEDDVPSELIPLKKINLEY